jgi:hypothetical protein
LVLGILGSALALACDAPPEGVLAPDMKVREDAVASSPRGEFVTGSGHFGEAVWRTWSFHAQVMPDGRVDGTFHVRGHRGHEHGGAKHQGRVVCLVEGNEAWFAGVDQDNMTIGFRVIDNGEGAAADPDLLGWQLRVESAAAYCEGKPASTTVPIVAGNIQVHGG